MKLRIALISIAMAAATALSGCASAGMAGIGTQIALNADAKLTPRDRQMLALAPDPTGEPPGTIVIDTTVKNLYFVLPGRQAIQYKVATGAESYGWTGRASVGQMQEWPRWMPTASLMEKWPEFKVYLQHGPLAGAYDNPLGARALYLYQGNRDTLYRIHGTNEPSEIGQAVSSGCIRMRDLDVIDLYSRVHVGTPVVVR
jgi:lipoprotein-anchoring transpeptidase ErfK/SrfK